ncbi:unnamed protein product [Durusdinium trenchii]|uniref:Carboxypeptidase n=1 Tax=Durusdinium trenchii TaxID=1381693 RepID=A0ABP0JYU4_9DINO
MALLAAWCLIGLVSGQSDAVDLGPRFSDYRSYAGMGDVDAGGLFYWYFEPIGVAAETPLLLWLQGGPGASSMLGNFYELGPVKLSDQGELVPRARNETWASLLPVLFVDSPVGTGWSWAKSNGSYAQSQDDVARNLHQLLELFARRHPRVPSKLVLAGESYGGHFVPALGAWLLQHESYFTLEAVLIGDGLTDPGTQVLTKPGVAFAFGLLDERRTAEAQRLANKAHAAVRAEHWAEAAEWRSAMEDLVKNVSLINPYDVRTTVQYSWDAMQKFFDQNSTKDLLHIPRALHFGTAPEVKENLKADIMKSQKPHVETLLGAGVRLLLYQGQFDWKDGVVSNEAWIRSLNWTGAEEFLSNERRVWRRPDEQIAGYWKSFKNLEQVVVLGAGHMVPMNQPLSEETKSDAALAVQSIPAYVEASDLFIALVPDLVHADTGVSCNYTSWLSRGWCRAELWCRLLSNREDPSVICLFSAKEAEFIFPLDWQQSRISDGAFTVESDREEVVKLGEMALKSKLDHLKSHGRLTHYRFYLAWRAKLLNQDQESWDLNGFLEHFDFPSISEAIKEQKGMTGMCCAVMAGDTKIIRQLVEHRADAA